MDFYGFSNSVQQANQQATANDLANSAYNLYNAGAEASWRQNQYNALQPTIDADKKRGKDDDSRVLTEEVEQGGGTAVGFGGVIALGKGVKDTTNKVSKAIRIGEAQLEPPYIGLGGIPPPIPPPLSRSSRTKIRRPSSSVSCRVVIALRASLALAKLTIPQPLDRSPSIITSACSTWPTCLKWSLRPCHVTLHARLPT